MTRDEIAKATKREREKLVADLRALTEDQWDAPTLCSEWRVRDVVGHLIRLWDYNHRQFPLVWDLTRNGLRLDRALSRSAQRIGQRPTSELLSALERARFEETLVFRLHPRPIFSLAEFIVHGQDIRRPLGLATTFETEDLIAIGNIAQKWYTWGARKRRIANRLEATDADFVIDGGQATLRGPLEAVVLASFGRESALKELVLVARAH